MDTSAPHPDAPSVKIVRFLIETYWYLSWVFAFVYLAALLTGYGIAGDLAYSKTDGIYDEMLGPATWYSSRHLFNCIFFMWITYHLRHIAHAVAGGNPFIAATPQRIRLVAYGIFAWGPFAALLNIALGALDTTMKVEGAGSYSFSISSGPLLFGLVVLALAHIFELGVKLQTEQDLTV